MGGWLASIEAYHRSMDALGQLAGADIVSAPHKSLARLASAHGAVYKPSGAGGGDVGIAFAASRHPLEAFAKDARKAGYTPLDLAIDFNGVEVIEE
jgi:phosphomevalonate kinase